MNIHIQSPFVYYIILLTTTLILGNERADELANKAKDTPFTGPEPVLGLPYRMVRRTIGDWMERKHIVCWKSSKDCKNSKALNKAGLLNCQA